MTDTAFLFPGQGSQSVGMGKALFDTFEVARRVFERADEVLGFGLTALCFEGPESDLTATRNTQPAILTCSIAACEVLRTEVGIEPVACLGHSLGEFSALVAAGALRFEDAVAVVHERGRAMQEAVPAGQGAMAAVIGLSWTDLEALCAEARHDQVVSPANENGGGQIVVAGHDDAVKRLVALAKAKDARAIPLRVSAPFHCALMEPAARRLDAALRAIDVSPLSVPVITNVEAEPNTQASRVHDLLVKQVTHPVRWESSVRRVIEMGATRALEIGHGNVLRGLVRRIDRALKVMPVGSPADIDVLKVGS